MTLLTALYIVGITAEAMTGALAAGRERMDLFGVIMIACVTAIGGGSVRDMLLGHYPLTWVAHPEYLVLLAVTAILTVSIAPLMRYFRTVFLWLDALGLIVFTILGAQVAMSMGYGVVIACTAGIITGVFGGVLRDLLCSRIPLIFRKELYASVSLLAALLYVGLVALDVPEIWTVLVTVAVGFTARILAIHFELGLPVFDYQEIEHRPRSARRPPWRRRARREPDRTRRGPDPAPPDED